MTSASDAIHDLTEQAVPQDAVGKYLSAELGDESWRNCGVELISGGKSNLTFVVSSGTRDVVLRRPPLSNRLPTAHDMAREHRVMTALWDTPVPVPQTLAMCTDDDVIGAPFYVMDRVNGHIVRDELPAGYAVTAQERQAIGHGLIDTLVDLHAVDPQAVGLEAYGKPSGYLERQIRRWTTQWESTRLEDDPNGSELDRLAARLVDSLPDAPSGPLVHGDFKLDNVVLDPAAPGTIAAVLDWELSTLGDPLADVGLFYIYWQDASDHAEEMAGGVLSTVTTLPGFPSRRDLLERYAAGAGADLSTLSWYIGFAGFKLAVVIAGVAARGRAGAMIGDGFIELAARITPLITIGHLALDGELP